MSVVRVGLDATGVPERAAGAGRYVLELASRVANEETSPIVISRRDDAQRWQFDNNTTVLPIAPTSRLRRVAWQRWSLPKALDGLGLDCFHGTHYVIPHIKGPKLVATVHDMTFFDHAEQHQRAKVQYFRRAIADVCERADAIVCVSDVTRKDMLRRFTPRGEVVTIHHGVDPEKFHPIAPEDDAVDAGVRLENDLQKPFILFLGTLEPRKNPGLLLEAFEKLAATDDQRELVMVGQIGWQMDGFLAQLDASPVRERVRMLGYQSDTTVASLLRSAEVVVYPSEIEGFGLPVLEALVSGARVVTGAAGAHAELFGSDVTPFDRADGASIAAAIQTAENGPRPDANAIAALLLKFSWQASADAHRRLYHALV